MFSPNTSGLIPHSPVSSGSAVILQKFDLKNKELKKITEELTGELLNSQNENRLLRQKIESLLKVQDDNIRLQNQTKMLTDRNDVLIKDKRIVDERVDYLLSRLEDGSYTEENDERAKTNHTNNTNDVSKKGIGHGQRKANEHGTDRNTLAKLDEIARIMDHQMEQNGDVASLLRNAEHLNEVYKQDLVKRENEMKKLMEEQEKLKSDNVQKLEKEKLALEKRETEWKNSAKKQQEEYERSLEELKEEFERTESRYIADIEALRETVNEQTSLIQELEKSTTELRKALADTEKRAALREQELLEDVQSLNQSNENLMNEIVLLQQAIEEQMSDADSEINKLRELVEIKDENSF